MKKSLYSDAPATFEKWDAVHTLVNYDVAEVTISAEVTRTAYECSQVLVEGQPTYQKVTEALIRVTYSVSDELAILRQRDTKPEEFKAYDAFVEDCKAKAKKIMGIDG